MTIRKRIKIKIRRKTGAKRMKEKEVTTKRMGKKGRKGRKLVKGTTKNQKLKRKSNSN